jgi:hypothetical protein
MLAWEREQCLEDIRAVLRAFEEMILYKEWWSDVEDRRYRLALVDMARNAADLLEQDRLSRREHV